MDAAFSYSAFGLKVLSDINCDPCPRGSTPADVVFRFGEVAGQLEHPHSGAMLGQASPGYFLLKIDQIAQYLVTEGTRIVIECAPAASEDTVRLILLGSPVAALLHQRGVLPLHASAIVTPKGAVIFAGSSGCGKSTLACVFQLRGYPVLADEVCPVTAGNESFVLPAVPTLMLWADALEHLGLKHNELKRARPEIHKYLLPLGDSFQLTPIPLYKIYILEPASTAGMGIIPISGLDSVKALSAVTYRPNLVRGMHLSRQHFNQITTVAAQTPMARVSHTAEISRIQVLADLLEKDFTG